MHLALNNCGTSLNCAVTLDSKTTAERSLVERRGNKYGGFWWIEQTLRVNNNVTFRVCTHRVHQLKMAADAARHPHSLCRDIRRIRQEQEINQEEAAERCGLHRTYYSGVERGVRNVSLVKVEKIAKGLKMALPEGPVSAGAKIDRITPRERRGAAV